MVKSSSNKEKNDGAKFQDDPFDPATLASAPASSSSSVAVAQVNAWLSGWPPLRQRKVEGELQDNPLSGLVRGRGFTQI